ncbi:MAG: 3-isopropylmalate dehydratase small subunit [Verrucomicrobiota bacterium]
MALKKITQVSGTGVYIAGDDIDTDRIIPARFMKCVTFDTLGEFMFYDVRKDAEGNDREHPLNDPKFAGSSIIISGNNFGCGSSREHAPQAIFRAGFNAVIAEGYAEIFFGNSTNLGIPCVNASKEDIQTLVAAIEAEPKIEITIDLENSEIRFGEDSIQCSIRDGARLALTNGKWDPIGELLEGAKAVTATAANLPYTAA